MSDNLPDEPFSFVGAPTPRRSITMPATQPFKAAFTFVVTFIGAVLVFVQDKTEFSDLTPLQWLIVLGFALVNTAGVYQITNPPVARRRREAGQTNLLYVLLVIAAALLVIWLLAAVIR